MSKRFTVPVEVDEDDQCFVTLPEELLQDLGWYEGMAVEWSEDIYCSIILKKSEEQN